MATSTTSVPRYLHAERPNGAHAWTGPFYSDEALLSWLRLFAPLVPVDATWDVTPTTHSSR